MKKIYTKCRGKRKALSVSIIYALFYFALILGAVPVMGQERIVTGTITSGDDGQPVPGATVVVKGTTSGTVTDLDGNFRLSVSGSDVTLTVSFVGYQKEEIVVGDRTVIDVSLQPDITSLEEVVVVGYGAQKKKVATAATVFVKEEDIQKTNSLRIEQAIQGQTAGVSIVTNSGQPGSAMKVRVRGVGTVGNNDPLYLVDGVPVEDISYLDPASIERVDVLKDASSAAIYGARASNGVVLITTKSGKEGKPILSLNTYVGRQNAYKKPDLLDARQYANLLNEASQNSGSSVLYNPSQIAAFGEGTNWFDEALNDNAPISNVSLNLSGASEKSSFSLGFSKFKQEGIIGGDLDKSVYDRTTFTINTSNEAVDGLLRIGENLTYSNSKQNGVATGGIYFNSIRPFFNAAPIFDVYDENGEYDRSPFVDQSNPIASMAYNNFNDNKNDKLLGNVFAELTPINGLTLRSSFGVELNFSTGRSFVPVYELTPSNRRTVNEATQSATRSFNYNLDNTIKYELNTGPHNVEFLLGNTVQERTSVWSGATYEGLIFSDFDHAYLDNGTSDTTINAWGSRFEYALFSLFARVQYNFNEKYLLTATVRRDYSSNFGENNRYGDFPSVSAGWVISDEDFFDPLTSFIDFMKLRASWGQNGNDRIGTFQYVSLVNSINKNYYFGSGDAKYVGSAPDDIDNPDIKWETSEQIDIGVEASLFQDFTLAVDLYKKSTKDWLVTAPIPLHVGANSPTINGGKIENKGLELELGYKKLFGSIEVGLNGNIAFNKNQVTRIDNEEKIIHGDANLLFQGIDEVYRAEVGYPVGYFYGLKVDGIFQNQQEIDDYNVDGQLVQPGARPGDVRFADLNGDGVINDEDNTMIGSPHPDYTYGFNLDLRYKGFDLSAYTYGMGGKQNLMSVRSYERFYNNYTTEILDRWTGEGSSNSLPRVTLGNEPNQNYQRSSELYVKESSFFRIKALNLGYNFASLFGESPFQEVRLYFSANNLFTVTKYPGLDPEVGFGGTGPGSGNVGWASGLDVGYYPQPRTFLLGLNVKL